MNSPSSLRRLTALALLLSLGLFGCVRTPDLIPRDEFFAPTLRSNLMVSPDGRYISWYDRSEETPRLMLRELASGEERALISGEGVSGYHLWSRDSRLVLHFLSADTVRGFFAREVETGREWPLLVQPTDPAKRDVPHDIALEILEQDANDPAWVAVRMNQRIASVPDLYKLNLYTGDLVELSKGSDNLLRWYVDHDLNLRGKLLSEPDGGQSFWRYNASSGKFSKEITWTINDDASWPVSFDLSGDNLYMFDSRGHEARALVTYNMKSRESTEIASSEQYDIAYVLFDHQQCKPLAAVLNGERLEYITIDPDFSAGLEQLEGEVKGDLRIVSRSLDNSIWGVQQILDNAPPAFYLFDRNNGEVKKLFDMRSPIKGKLAKMELIEFNARDGLTLHGYVTKPVKGGGPWPTVLLVHTGPWMRDLWGYNPEVQWLANRGYTVLQINFRGSDGYGKKFVNAGNREWGEAMSTDLVDGVNWLVKQGVAKENKIAIAGESYGGYAALAGACFTPGVYAAAIAVNPFIDLTDYLSNIPPTWEAYRTNLENRIGVVPRYESGSQKGIVKDSTDWNETDLANIEDLKSRSPYYHVKRIEIPVLLASGVRDPIARNKVAERFVKKLRMQGKTIEYVPYEKTAHRLRQADWMDFYPRAEVFLAAYLGGALEPPEMEERELEVSVTSR